MNKIVMTVAAVTTLATAMPVMAERGQNLDERVEKLQDEIQQGVRRGAISRSEARPLRDHLRQLTRLERHYSRGGFSRQEQRDLQQRIRTLRQRIHFAQLEHGRNGRGGRR